MVALKQEYKCYIALKQIITWYIAVKAMYCIVLSVQLHCRDIS